MITLMSNFYVKVLEIRKRLLTLACHVSDVIIKKMGHPLNKQRLHLLDTNTQTTLKKLCI